MTDLFENYLEVFFRLHDYMETKKPRWNMISETLKILWRCEQVLIQKYGAYWHWQEK